MRQTWVALVILACGGGAPAAIWDGEPADDLAALIKSAEAGDQGARVELAWHAYEYHGVYRDLDRIRQWFTPAHEAGDPLATAGLAFLASAGKDFGKAHELGLRAAATGHPQGKAALGMLLTGTFTPAAIRDPGKGMALLDEAVEGGSIAAACFRAGHLMYDKTTPEVRRRALAVEIGALPPEMIRVALWIARWGNDALGIGDEQLAAVLPTLVVADRCGHPSAGYFAAEVQRRLSRDAQAIPAYIETANADHSNYGGFSKGYLFALGHHRAERNQTLMRLAWSDWGDLLAADAVQTAVTHDCFVQRGVYTIAGGHDGAPPDPEKAIGILLKLAKTGDGGCDTHTYLANLYSTELPGCPGDYLDLELAAAHFIVHCHHGGSDWGTLHRILTSPRYPGGPRLAEAWAAGRQSRKHPGREVSTEKMLRLRTLMTPGEIMEGERLYEDGYPTSRKFRIASEQFLRERGQHVHPYIRNDAHNSH